MASLKVFISMMARLEAAFGTQDDARHALYLDMMHDVSDPDFVASSERCVRELRTFPTIRDILDRLPGRLSLEQSAEAAWTRVMAAAFHGPTSYNPHTGSFPTGEGLDADALDAIGGANGLYRLWEAEDDPQQIGFARRDFIERYRTMGAMGAKGFLSDGRPMRELGMGRGGVLPRIEGVGGADLERRRTAAFALIAGVDGGAA